MTSQPAASEVTEADEPDPKTLKGSEGGVGNPASLWIVRAIVLVIVLIWLVPAVGLLITSLREQAFIETSGWWTVFTSIGDTGQWTLSNYQEVLTTGGFDTAFVNTLVVAVPATVIPITIAAFAAYAFSWMNFPGRFFLFTVIVALLVVPLHVALIPILRLYAGGVSFDVSWLSPVVSLVTPYEVTTGNAPSGPFSRQTQVGTATAMKCSRTRRIVASFQ